jgi:hypothetical protein
MTRQFAPDLLVSLCVAAMRPSDRSTPEIWRRLHSLCSNLGRGVLSPLKRATYRNVSAWNPRDASMRDAERSLQKTEL